MCLFQKSTHIPSNILKVSVDNVLEHEVDSAIFPNGRTFVIQLQLRSYWYISSSDLENLFLDRFASGKSWPVNIQDLPFSVQAMTNASKTRLVLQKNADNFLSTSFFILTNTNDLTIIHHVIHILDFMLSHWSWPRVKSIYYLHTLQEKFVMVKQNE